MVEPTATQDRTQGIPPGLLIRQGNRTLALMLVLLHAALVWGEGQPWGQAVTLAHYGAFLLWQPFLSGAQRLPWTRAVVVLAVGFGLAAWPSLLGTALWGVMLAALLGGMAVGVRSPRERAGLLLAFLYLLALLLLWMMPRLFGLPVGEPGKIGVWRDGLLLLPLLVAFLPAPDLRRDTVMADLLYAVVIFLLIGVLLLGSFVAMRLADTSYAGGVLISSSGLTAALALLVWLWNPRSATSGLRNIFSRYVLSLGLPLEEWLKRTAEAAERENDAEAFIQATMKGFSTLPWATGVTWQTAYSQGKVGRKSPHSVGFSHLGVEAVFYADGPLNPAFALQLRLLTDVIGYFYAAKIREQALHANAYTQAIYETGSRLTHDVKNMLQSLKALSSAAEHSGPEQSLDLQGLVQRQLPQIVKRLEITLDKLKSPQARPAAEDRGEILSREWWRNLRNRYLQDNVEFQTPDADAEAWLPQDLFDSVADNLLQNALRKRRQDPDVHIRVCFSASPRLELKVCDDGSAAPPEIMQRLFHAPVSNHDGLGIGLYQAAKQADESGYRLELIANREGEVCFRLVRPEQSTPAASEHAAPPPP